MRPCAAAAAAESQQRHPPCSSARSRRRLLGPSRCAGSREAAWRLAAASSAAAAATAAAISLEGLSLTFTGRGISKRVLDSASLDVPRGSFHMLLGANGCGKSTLLRVVAGLFRPDAGRVHGKGRRAGLLVAGTRCTVARAASPAQAQRAREPLVMACLLPPLPSGRSRRPLRLGVPKPRPPGGDAHSGCRRGVWPGKVGQGWSRGTRHAWLLRDSQLPTSHDLNPSCCCSAPQVPPLPGGSACGGAARAAAGGAAALCGAPHKQPERRAEAARGHRGRAGRVPTREAGRPARQASECMAG